MAITLKPKQKTAAPQPVDPLTGLTPGQQASYLKSTLASIYNPIQNQLAQQFEQRANNVQQAITGYTNALAGTLSGSAANTQAAYDHAVTAQAAVDAALQAALHGQADQAASDLAQRLSSTGVAPDVQQRMSGNVADRYQGEQAAAAARGAATLSQLLGNAAAAQSYAQGMPGVAAAQGLAATRQLQAQTTSDLGQALQNLRSQEGQTASSILSTLATSGYRNALLGIQQGRLGVQQQNANTAARRASSAAAVANAKLHAPDPALSKTVGVLVDGTGAPILKNGQPQVVPGFKLVNGQPVKASGASGGQLSASQRRKMLDDLNAWTQGTPAKRRYDSASGKWLKVPGTGSQPLPYNQVVQNLVQGYGLSQQQAQQLANSRYAPGEYGRPYPVPPPPGTVPLSPSRVIVPSGHDMGITYRLVKGRWVAEPSKLSDYQPGGIFYNPGAGG